ncbi:MAG TPA: hypothetical protein VHA06_01550 [Candidatus Angelobacter sp.]|nr:hypothetical protein [Candidatus Angelobacter sp.]
MKALIQEINDLKTRLAAVESKQSQTAPAAAEPAATPVPSYAAPTQSYEVLKGIKFQGFGEVGWRANDNPAGQLPIGGFSEGPNGNFAIGDFDLFLTSRINDKTSVLSEIVFEAADAQSFNVNLARMLLTYNQNDYLKISLGRYHTSTSYYNQVFHSGAWLQTLIDRPLAVEFAQKGGLLPTQAIGASITGKLPSGKLDLNYFFEYGTSDTIRPDITSKTSASIDESNGNGTTVGFFMKPDRFPGLNIGGSFYHDRINPTDTPFDIGQTIYSAHLVYTTPKLEFLNEVFLIQHDVTALRTFNTPAFYSLISDNVSGKWRPYVMYQYANANAFPVVFGDVGLFHGPSAGVRYDFNGYVAVKAQYDHTFRRDPLPNINTIKTQLAFRF